jgi:RHS repeat-associated protein
MLMLWLLAVAGFSAPATQAQAVQSITPGEGLYSDSSSMELLTGVDERRNAEEAVLAGPEAIAARARSRTQYERLDGVEAVSLAERVFGIAHPQWVAPGSERGARIDRYLNDNEAVEVTPTGQRLLVASTSSLMSSVGSGQQAPTSLALEERGSAYLPRNPLVPVSIAKDAASGVSLPFGYGVAPLQAGGQEASRVVGNRVVYPGTAKDTMFMVEPIPQGVEASWELLSEESPQENSLQFSLPEGASLQMSTSVPGAAEVVKEGQTIMLIPQASAVQADGVSLPVSYSISGDILATHVDLSGSVAFPVMIDPIVAGTFGTYGAGTWPGWSFHQSACSCFGYTQNSGLLEVGEEGQFTNNEWGEWVIWAPGEGEEGGASIMRVDVTGLAHQAAYQSYMEFWLIESNGKPAWTFNGYAGAMGEGPIWTGEAYSGYAASLCADGAGGKDGGEQPLCNENYGAKGFAFADVLGPNSRTVPNYVQITGASVKFLDTTAPNEVYIEDLPSGWAKYGPSPTWIYGHDQGTGVAAFKVEIPPGHLNEKGEPFFAQSLSCAAEAGFVGCPKGSYSNAVSFSELPTGAYTLGVYAYDAVGNVREQSPDPHLYIDHTPPQMEALAGSLVEDASKVGAGSYTLNFGAVDGSESAPQSGVHTITVSVDGSKADEVTTTCPSPTGVPTANCYGLSGSWTMEGERYGAGPHTITVTAKDWVGNESTQTLHITADEAAYTGLGPGAVNMQTGDFKLGATDVNAGGAGASLTLSRSYESRNLTTGVSGPLGPQWSLSLPDSAADGVWQSLSVEPSGNVSATLTNGERLAFVRNGTSFTSPEGYQTEMLSGSPAEKPTEYRLTNAVGDQTIFKHAEHEEEGRYTPVGVVQAEGAGGLNKVSDIFEKTSEGITRPMEVLAPAPAGVNCEASLVKGCRALSFNYAESTTATGEGPEEWGDYKGHLTRVYLHAWNPKAGEKGEMTTTTVAQYAYDSRGRLRAEWNPQISPALKTTYGYDAEGHVTAVTAPGQETWALSYGTTGTDSNAGRLLKALQAPASAGVWKGEAVTSTEAPRVSGAPVVGGRLAVSGGKWSGSPVAYAYRWKDCNSAGSECSTINGADNANYTPTGGDVGHSLVAEVIATNGGGSTVAMTAASSEVVQPGEAFSAYKLSSPFECPDGVAAGPDGNMWFTDACAHQVGKITPTGETAAYNFPSGVCLGGIAAGLEGNMWAAEECTNRLARITTTGEITEYSLPEKSHPVQVVAVSHYLWFTEFGTSKIGEFDTMSDKVVAEYSLPAYSDPYGITAGPEGDLWFTEWAPSKIGKMTTGGEITEYAIGVPRYPLGITVGPDKNMWFTEEGTSQIGKITTSGSITEYQLPSGSVPTSIAAGPDGNLRFTEAKANKIGEITTSGQIGEYALPAGSDPLSITTAKDSNHMWFTEYGSDQVGEISTGVLGAYKLSAPFQCPHYTAEGPDGNVWFTDNCDHQVGKITPGGISTAYNFASGVELAGITAGPDGNVWAAEEGAGKVAKVTTSGSITEYALASGSQPRDIAAGADKNLWVSEHGTNKIAKVTTSGSVTEYSLPSGSNPSGITAGPEESLWTAETGTNKIAKITTSGSITEHSLPSGSKPAGIVEGVDGNLWITLESTNKVAKMTPSGSLSEYSLPSGSRPAAITSGPEGDLWATLEGASKIARITTSGTITEYALATGSRPIGIAPGPAGELWVADNGSNSIETISPPASTSEGEVQAPQPGWSVDYNVPVTGAGAPQAMGEPEVAKWAQKDDPASATAIFPPDKPQGWPASSYQRATIYYFDSQERTVNVASPAGGITTTEYNATNDNVERTLSADNRATALKESKSVEVAEHLSTESTYNTEGTELTSAVGPEHKIKLPNGEEVQARKHTAYSYNEGAPTEGGPFYLVTKTIETAKLANGEEKAPRTITDSYSGQEGLGWKLKEPTSTTTTPGGLSLTHTTLYNAATGAEIETRSPGANAAPSLHPSQTFGGSGSGAGQLEKPAGVAVGASGDVWVADTGHDRVQEFDGKGEFVREFGAAGAEAGEFSSPRGIAVSGGGDVYVADAGNNRVQEFNASGEFVRKFGSEGSGEGKFRTLTGVAVDSEGHVWTVEAGISGFGAEYAPRVQEFTAEGVFIRQFGVEGKENGQFKKPEGIAVDGKGDVWVADSGNNRIEEFKPTGEFLRVFGSEGSGDGQFKTPTGLAFDAEGDLWVTDSGNDRIQRFTAEGAYLSQVGKLGNNNGQFNEPKAVAIDASGNVWVADTANNRVQELTGSEFVLKFGGSGSGAGQLEKPAGVAVGASGDVWVADTGHDRVQEFDGKGEFVREFGAAGAEAGEFSSPRGIAVSGGGDVYVADAGNNRVQEFNASGEFVRKFGSEGSGEGKFRTLTGVAVDSEGHVWTVEAGISGFGAEYAPRVQEFTAEGVFIRQFGVEGKENGQFKKPEGIAVDGKGDVWVADSGNNRIEEFKPTGEFLRVFGSEGSGDGQFKTPTGLAFDAEGDLWVTDSGNDRVQSFTAEGGYLGQEGTLGNNNGQLNEPKAVAIDGSGNLWVADTANNRVQEWSPQYTPQQRASDDSQTIYYTAGTEAGVEECENHPEWANLPCRTQPAHQPETAGLPELPISTYKYNLYNEPEVTTSTSGSATRTETDSYDAAGRLISKELSGAVGTSMPKITYEYNKETGLLEKQTAGEQTITSVYNSLGQLASYTDGNEGTSTYKYDSNGRTIEEATPYGSQTYSYSETTGLESELTDSAAGTFTATYDPEGNLVSETLPNGVTACYGRNATGEATSLEYRRSAGCVSGSVWFTDNATPTIHEQWASQTSSLSSETYGYDEAGRLTEVQETPVGKGCTVRLYAYDQEGNRTSLTTREPGREGKCAVEGGSVANHSYDAANRLTDAGVAYNPFGDVTSLPAADAGGATLESGFYADGQVAEQRQEGVTLGYQLDPARRISQITTTSSKENSTLINHYAGEGASPAWTTEPGGKWMRYIFGISNGLEAIQTDAEPPVLQLSNLHGDIMATAADEEAASGLLSSTNTTEYGVPTTGSPSRYSWLGTQELPTEFPSGVTAMGARSYVPQLGRFLQPDPKPGGSENAYAYTHGNPLNETDPSGQWSLNQTSGGLSAVGTGEGTQLPGGTGIAAGAIMPAPVNAQLEAAFWASPPWDQVTAGSEEYEEYEEYEEEGEEEYASNKQSTEGHTESGVLRQPLEGLEGDTGEPEAGSTIFVVGGCPSTHDPCYPKHGKGGKRNEGGTGTSCRSGAQSKGKCVVNHGKQTSGNYCRMFAGSTAGLAAVSGPGGIILWFAGGTLCYVSK